MKDFFFFSKSQTIGSIVLILLVVFVILLNRFLPLFFQQNNNETELVKFKQEVVVFGQTLQEKEKKKQQDYEQRYKQKYASSYRTRKSYSKQNVVKTDYILFSFDPNQADSVDFINIGLSPRIASNILKYRSKGGQFRTVEQFGKIYGISSKKFEELKPYILISEEPIKKDTLNSPKLFAIKKDTILELNTSDTTHLKMIRGIGSGYAKSIIYYRNQLGGYYNIEQLREIPYIKEELFQQLKKSFTVDTVHIKPIDVNTASVDYLSKHPYINFYQAKAMYELRRLEFELISIEQLLSLEEFTEEEIERLRPYLLFQKKKKRSR